eukprot:gene78-104_t
MPKVKTHSGAKKRFSITAKGKIKRKHAFKNHMLDKKQTKQKRRLTQSALVHNMPRSVNAVASRARKKRVLKLAKGYWGRRKNVWTVAKNAVERGLQYAYRDRKNKKREFRALWIQRINAAAKLHGISYSKFMGKLAASEINMNRKVLADLAMNHPDAFKERFVGHNCAIGSPVVLPKIFFTLPCYFILAHGCSTSQTVMKFLLISTNSLRRTKMPSTVPLACQYFIGCFTLIFRTRALKLPYDFYNRHVVEVAKDLLGKTFVWGNHRGLIIETEAYRGADDAASHAARGITPRSKTMFGPPGHVYVYLIYGMYYCLNVVTEEEGQAGAVLIRGIKLPDLLLDGPGKVCRHLGINQSHNGLNLTMSPDAYFTYGTVVDRYVETPRIGIKKATDKLWRFTLVPDEIVAIEGMIGPLTRA